MAPDFSSFMTTSGSREYKAIAFGSVIVKIAFRVSLLLESR